MRGEVFIPVLEKSTYLDKFGRLNLKSNFFLLKDNHCKKQDSHTFLSRGLDTISIQSHQSIVVLFGGD